MFRFVVVLVVLCVASAFAPSARFGARSMQMSMDKQVKNAFTAAIIAASFMNGLPAIAAEGAAPKQNFGVFGEAASSPFVTTETREDPIYSPYSPYGSGAAASYNDRKGSKEEISFWQNQLVNSAYVISLSSFSFLLVFPFSFSFFILSFCALRKRVDNVPELVGKADWQSVRAELTSYAYNMREAMNRWVSLVISMNLP